MSDPKEARARKIHTALGAVSVALKSGAVTDVVLVTFQRGKPEEGTAEHLIGEASPSELGEALINNGSLYAADQDDDDQGDQDDDQGDQDDQGQG